MPLPQIADVALKHLFSPLDRMLAAGVPEITANRILRLRDAYTYWLQFPDKRDREMVGYLQRRYGISVSTSYEDLNLVKNLLGNLQKASKDYHRYRAIERFNRAYDMAAAVGNTRDMIAAMDKLAKYVQLDKEDEKNVDWDAIVPQRFIFTDDPSVLGFRRIPNVRERISDLKSKLFTDDIKEVEFEEIDFNQEELFRPKHINKDGTAGGKN